MIKYALKCGDCAESYEAWFSSSLDFDDQKSKGFVVCPICNSQAVDKCLMAPEVSTSKKQSSARAELRKIKKYIENNFEDVGDNFAKEALAMHYGDREPANITGNITREDSRKLHSEGIEHVIIPNIKDDA